MVHFPSQLHTGTLPRRSDSLNATQQKPSSHQMFLTIEDELHDARRVHSHGQEEDLRLALDMVINRVAELSTLLKDAYKAHADLETQLNLAKSNLQLVISNNEMLEEALKRDSGHAKDVGWRRRSARESDEQQRISGEFPVHSPFENAASTAPTSPVQPSSESRFFRFRFSGSTPNVASGNGTRTPQMQSRPGTPLASATLSANGAHFTSPSLPSLPSHHLRELEELNAELEKERQARVAVAKEKEALEAEIESLSQALFEEANKMVATERIRRFETEEELKEANQEKEALRSALQLVEGENVHLRSATSTPALQSTHYSRSPSPTSPASVSSNKAIKSPTHSRAPSSSSVIRPKKHRPLPDALDLPEMPYSHPTPASLPTEANPNISTPCSGSFSAGAASNSSGSGDSNVSTTPQFQKSSSLAPAPIPPTPNSLEEPSPWADQ